MVRVVRLSACVWAVTTGDGRYLFGLAEAAWAWGALMHGQEGKPAAVPVVEPSRNGVHHRRGGIG